MEELIAPIRARLTAAAETRDPAGLLELDALVEARALAAALAERGPGDPAAADAGYQLGWLHWLRSRWVDEAQRTQESDTAARYFLPLYTDPTHALPRLPSQLLPTLANLAVRTVTEAGDHTAGAQMLIDTRITLWCRILETAGDQTGVDRGGRLLYLGLLLLERFAQNGEVDDLEAAIHAARAGLGLLPAGDRQRPMGLATLVRALTELSGRTGRSEDLAEAVATGRLAAAATARDEPARAAILATFGIALLKSAERTRSAELDDELVTVALQALDAVGTCAGQRRADYLSLLGSALRVRFEHRGDLAELDRSIETHREAVSCVPIQGPPRADLLSNLGGVLRLRFEWTGESDALHEAVALGRRAVNDAAEDDPEHGGFAMALGLALMDRFERYGDRADLAEAERHSRAGAASPAGSRSEGAARLSNLSVVLQSVDEHTAAAGTAAEAVSVARRALAESPEGDAGLIRRESNLANALVALYQRTGKVAALDEAVNLARRVAESVSTDDPDLARCLSNAGIALRSRFTRTGALTDLDEAIALGQRAVRAVPVEHVARPDYLTNIGVTLQTRADRTGSTEDLTAAVEAHSKALADTPIGHPMRPRYLANVAAALQTRAQHTGSDDDLTEAVDAARDATRALPHDSPLRPQTLANLGNCLCARYRRGRARDDIDAAVLAHSEAVKSLSPAGPALPAHLSGYAVALRERARATGSLDDLDAAITGLVRAVSSSAEDGPEAAALRTNLGIALTDRFQLSGAPEDRRTAVSELLAAFAIQNAPPSVRLSAARGAAMLLTADELASAPEHYARLFASAVELLPQLAGRHLPHSDQREVLGGLGALIAEAVAAALSADPPPDQSPAERAVRLLESGRAVLHSQVLDLRGDLTELQRRDAELARRFIELRDLLDHPAGTEPLAPSNPAHPDRYALNQEFETVLERIRALPGLHSFATLPAIRELRAAAAQGPVVMFNVSRHRSDALVLADAELQAVRLPDLAPTVLGEQIAAFHDALADAAASTYAARLRARARIDEVLGWLWDVAAEPVLKALALDKPPSATTGITRVSAGADRRPDWPRMWWAPGGLLGLLPLHAAGHRDPARRAAGDAVIERVISSYTLTIRALLYARQKAERAASPRYGAPRKAQSLIVAVPATERERSAALADARSPQFETSAGAARQQTDLVGLEYAVDEAEAVAARVPGPILLTGAQREATAAGQVPEDGPEPATRGAVFAHLPECSIAHFACHGTTDSRDPSLSHLVLQDHATAPLTVDSLRPIKLDRAELAYLSACRTAYQDGTALLDEAIHLASAFQLSGFPHVVATLWEVKDPVSVRVADDFYARLTVTRAETDRGDRTATAATALDPNHTAAALHGAVRALSRAPGYRAAPWVWASYIHIGA